MKRKLILALGVMIAMCCVTLETQTADAGIRIGVRGGWGGYRGGYRGGWGGYRGGWGGYRGGWGYRGGYYNSWRRPYYGGYYGYSRPYYGGYYYY